MGMFHHDGVIYFHIQGRAFIIKHKLPVKFSSD